MLYSLFSVAAAASALSGPPPPMPPHRPLIDMVGEPEFDLLAERNGMSPAGIAALHNLPAAAPVKDTNVECAIVALTAARPLDIDRLDEALAVRDAARAAQTTRHHVVLISALRVLDDADAAIFLRLVGTSERGGMMMVPPPGGMIGPGGRRGKREERRRHEPPAGAGCPA